MGRHWKVLGSISKYYKRSQLLNIIFFEKEEFLKGKQSSHSPRTVI